MTSTGPTIAPCLWFDDQAEEAAAFYTRIFPDSRIVGESRYPKGFDNPSGKPRGSVLTVEFEIAGTSFTALNGGPHFTINPSISFFCNFDPSTDPEAREHLDATWQELTDGGEVLMALDTYPWSERYGWVADRFGVSWQLILSDPSGEDRPFVVPSLMFVGDVLGRAQEAIDFYTSVFEESRMGVVARSEGGQPEGIMFADFMLAGQWLAAMDGPGDHQFGFNEATSLQVMCRDQDEVDRFWLRLSDGGEEGPCGWLKDRFGVSWQVVPERVIEILSADAADEQGYEQAFKAMLEMKKLDIGTLEDAYSRR